MAPLLRALPCPAPVSSGSGANPGWMPASLCPSQLFLDLLLSPLPRFQPPPYSLFSAASAPIPVEKPPENIHSLNLGAACPTPL